MKSVYMYISRRQTEGLYTLLNIRIVKKMKKIIKKYGNSAVIVLSSEDLKIMKKKVGDVITFQILKTK